MINFYASTTTVMRKKAGDGRTTRDVDNKTMIEFKFDNGCLLRSTTASAEQRFGFCNVIMWLPITNS